MAAGALDDRADGDDSDDYSSDDDDYAVDDGGGAAAASLRATTMEHLYQSYNGLNLATEHHYSETH